MDLKQIALYDLAGYGIYVVYQKYIAKPKRNCPELYGCGMPGPGVICTGEMQQPIPGCEGVSQRRPS
jgi:hypothetical protein